MENNIKLTEMSMSCGCAAKIGPDVLSEVLKNIPQGKDKNLLVGIETSDDAAVYRIDDQTAIVQTMDFFPPIVDDPYIYGQIAAANAISDVYAMGGEPKLVMNIACFPDSLPVDSMEKILRGGYDKVKEAGAIVVGGHTIEDTEPKFGLSVTGFIHPEKIITNCGAKVGDVLILCKPLGTGILNIANKGNLVSPEAYRQAINSMVTLNRFARDAMVKTGVNSCTDVTGFGLLGHCYEMAVGSGVTLKIMADSVPLLDEALEMVRMGIIPKGAHKNKRFTEGKVLIGNNVSKELIYCFLDPQTSGGLLISVSEEKVDSLLNILKNSPTRFAQIGTVIKKEEHPIIVV